MIPLRLALAAALAVMLTGCNILFWWRKPKREPHGTISVQVNAHGEWNAPIYVTVYGFENGERGPTIGTRLVKDGEVTGFIVPLDAEYEVRALADSDRDGRRSEGESVDSIRGVRPDADVTAAHRPLLLDLPKSRRPSASASRARSTFLADG